MQHRVTGRRASRAVAMASIQQTHSGQVRREEGDGQWGSWTEVPHVMVDLGQHKVTLKTFYKQKLGWKWYLTLHGHHFALCSNRTRKFKWSKTIESREGQNEILELVSWAARGWDVTEECDHRKTAWSLLRNLALPKWPGMVLCQKPAAPASLPQHLSSVVIFIDPRPAGKGRN